MAGRKSMWAAPAAVESNKRAGRNSTKAGNTDADEYEECEDDCGFKFQRKRVRSSLPAEPQLPAMPNVQGGMVVAAEEETAKKASPPTPEAAVVAAKDRRRKTEHFVTHVVPLARDLTASPAAPSAGTPGKQILDQRRRRSSFASVALRRNSRHLSIGMGLTTNLPPASVSYTDFHKHLMPDLPGPVKMRQLLVWAVQKCTLAITNAKHPNQSASVVTSVSELGELLIQGLFKNEINTSWYRRPTGDSTTAGTSVEGEGAGNHQAVPTGNAATKPNPKNQELLECLSLYKNYQDQLRSELAAWESVKMPVTELDALVGVVNGESIESLLTSSDKALLQEVMQSDSAGRVLPGVDAWMTSELPLSVDRLDWTLKVCSLFQEHSRQFCESVFHHIFARFYSADLEGVGASSTGSGSIEPMAVLRALSRS